MENEILVISLIFCIAILYSSVGHGGASGYLAVLGLIGVHIISLKSSALILNLFVSSIAFYQYYKAGHFKWKLFYPFAITSIPMAYLGGLFLIDPFWYKKILGVCIILSILRIAGIFDRNEKEKSSELPLGYALLSGAVIGLLSGMIGIGGGIILSPLLLLMNWGKVKEASAVSALFIFVNSLAGLAGIMSSNNMISSEIYPWIVAAVAGGLIGSYWGSRKASLPVLKNIVAGVLFFAAIKLLLF